MGTHELTVAAALLWALIFVAICGAVSQATPTDMYGRPIGPRGRFYVLWTWALVLLFLAAVGLTAWLKS